MRKFPKIAIILLTFSVLFFACTKEQQQDFVPNSEEIIEFQDISDMDEAITELTSEASTRGNCGIVAIKVEYTSKIEYEFDVSFSGLGAIHFMNNPTGTVKLINGLPLAVHPKNILLTNKPNHKMNPKCPWIAAKGEITISIFMANKNTEGQWTPVANTPILTYVLGKGTPTKILMSGSRVFCVDKPIGSWHLCNLYQPK